MLLTEEQARTKWCPHVRFAGSEADNNAANRWNSDAANPPLCRCIASECMAWRFGKDRPAETKGCPAVTPAMSQWVLDNPPPQFQPIFTDPDDVWDKHYEAMQAWGEKASAFLITLVHGPAPDGDGWEWCVGYDEDEEKPFAHWWRPAAKLGFCGLAGKVEG